MGSGAQVLVWSHPNGNVDKFILNSTSPGGPPRVPSFLRAAGPQNVRISCEYGREWAEGPFASRAARNELSRKWLHHEIGHQSAELLRFP